MPGCTHETGFEPKSAVTSLKNEEQDRGIVLREALGLIEQGYSRKADSLLTASLINSGHDAELWMAAGLARLKRGKTKSAATAFRMSSWLSGDRDADDFFKTAHSL